MGVTPYRVAGWMLKADMFLSLRLTFLGPKFSHLGINAECKRSLPCTGYVCHAPGLNSKGLRRANTRGLRLHPAKWNPAILGGMIECSS